MRQESFFMQCARQFYDSPVKIWHGKIAQKIGKSRVDFLFGNSVQQEKDLTLIWLHDVKTHVIRLPKRRRWCLDFLPLGSTS
jgi:hypothetical protein